MPKERIPLTSTNAFKMRLVLDYLDAAQEGMSRAEFCKVRGIKRPTLQTWQRKLKKLTDAASRDNGTPSRASKLTLGGSGRVSVTATIEDALVTFIKDARREEQIVTRDMIVRKAADLYPDSMEGRSYDAQMSWRRRFMSRSGLTIRRISHSGRKTHSELEKYRVEFVATVLEMAMTHCYDPRLGLAPKRTIFNMDQTSLYYNMSPRSTVDFVGATCVPAATEGAESYRCTMALTMAVDGCKFQPHFVFMGQPGGDVENEFRGYCDASVATFSVQAKAWFDLKVMLDWIENVWKGIVTEPSILILDSLKVHKMAPVLDALACTGTAVMFVPGGCTGVAQPLDVEIMGPLKKHIRNQTPSPRVGRPTKRTPAQRRRSMFDRAMKGLDKRRCAVHSTPPARSYRMAPHCAAKRTL